MEQKIQEAWDFIVDQACRQGGKNARDAINLLEGFIINLQKKIDDSTLEKEKKG